jgi:hypothetical protein
MTFEIRDPHQVMAQNKLTPPEVVNLCGGIPSPDISGISVRISSEYQAALNVQVETDQYEVARIIDFDLRRIDNQIMVVEEEAQGKHIGTYLFLNQVLAARDCQLERLRTIAMAPSLYDEEGMDWCGYYFWAELGFQNSEPELYAQWARENKRPEPTLSECVQTEAGRRAWRSSGSSWVGEFFLAKDHPCFYYLKRHLKRKGIEVRGINKN